MFKLEGIKEEKGWKCGSMFFARHSIESHEILALRYFHAAS